MYYALLKRTEIVNNIEDEHAAIYFFRTLPQVRDFDDIGDDEEVTLGGGVCNVRGTPEQARLIYACVPANPVRKKLLITNTTNTVLRVAVQQKDPTSCENVGRYAGQFAIRAGATRAVSPTFCYLIACEPNGMDRPAFLTYAEYFSQRAYEKLLAKGAVVNVERLAK